VPQGDDGRSRGSGFLSGCFFVFGCLDVVAEPGEVARGDDAAPAFWVLVDGYPFGAARYLFDLPALTVVAEQPGEAGVAGNAALRAAWLGSMVLSCLAGAGLHHVPDEVGRLPERVLAFGVAGTPESCLARPGGPLRGLAVVASHRVIPAFTEWIVRCSRWRGGTAAGTPFPVRR
jgi:hypothetical protein